VNLIKNLLADVTVTTSTGILAPPVIPVSSRGELIVKEEWKKIFVIFKTYFESEMEAIGDPTLEKEVKILEDLINPKGAEASKKKEPEALDKVATLMAMGFSHQQAIDALQKNGDDLQNAANSLFQ